MKKKLFVLFILLVAAAVLISGCSPDRFNSVKYNPNLILANNEDGDLAHTLGTIRTEEDFENGDSFGEEVITTVAKEFLAISFEETIEIDISGNGQDAEHNDSISFDLSSENDFSENLETINFLDGDLIIEIPDVNIDSLKVDTGNDKVEAYSIENGLAKVDISDSKLNFAGEQLTVDYEISAEALKDPEIEVYFNNVNIESLKVNFENFNWDNVDFEINETIVEEYEKDAIIDDIEVESSEMYLNFDENIPDKLSLDLTNVFVKSDSSEDVNNFNLGEVDKDNTEVKLDLEAILEMLKDEETTEILIAGEMDISSENNVLINSNSSLNIKSAVLESAELIIDHNLTPEAIKDGLSSSDVDNIKKGLESIEVTASGINNPLPAAVDITLYLKDGEQNLYENENILTSFSINANSSNYDEIIRLDKDDYDKFVGNNLHLGVNFSSDFTFSKEEYENQTISIERIIAKFNIDLKFDDLD